MLTITDNESLTSESVNALPPPKPTDRVAFNPIRDQLKQLEQTSNPKVLNKQRQKRVSRWDRAPEPRDWRWVVGHVGRMLITLGLLMFGFVAYQLWGTAIQEARSQDALKSAFEQVLAEQGITPDTIAPAPVTSVAAPTTAVTGSVAVSTPDSAPTPVTTINPSGSVQPSAAEPVRQELPRIEEGAPIAQIKIPTIGVSKVIVAGVSMQDLRKGPGHFPNTPFPGQLGNVAIAGHRTTYGQPFLLLDELKAGDPIEITTILGDSYVYLVTGAEEVGKNDYFIITDSDPTKATLTLITCTPIGTASRRLIIHAELEVARSSDVGEGVINYGQDFTATTDPVLPVDEPGQVVTTGGDQSSNTTVSTPGDAETPAPSAFVDSSDGFNQGWFADGGAWPHVAAWGVGLLLIWIAAYKLAKRFRRLWLGILVGVLPFVVLLYFFYENINRLLPAAI